ncbi:RICIN domain-containing protein [Mycobacteroides abscessus]|uniref:RICIN domain-containing protein n=1 Tax=Mycobacteroides abscessus TaxID=36809 RepID=UPI000C259E30|nr:RICIN domain-containing protein [Mycobacteroides abscessus]
MNTSENQTTPMQDTTPLKGLHTIAPAQNSNALYISPVPHTKPEDEVWLLRGAEAPDQYIISNLVNGEVLSLAGDESSAGSPIVQTVDTGAKWQRWKLTPDGDHWRITSVNNDHALDYQTPNPAKAGVIIHTDLRTQTQQWQLAAAMPASSLTIFAEFQSD